MQRYLVAFCLWASNCGCWALIRRHTGPGYPSQSEQWKGKSYPETPKDTRGTLGNAISGVVSAISPSSCLGDLLMTGYTNDLYGEDDYRYQPSCYNGGEANRLMCFPSSARVLTSDKGLVRMSELETGDSVLSLDAVSRKPSFQPVLFFLHRDPLRISDDWVKVVHEYGSLTLSSTHLLFKDIDGGRQSLAAKRVRAGDVITFVEPSGVMVNSTVVRTDILHDRLLLGAFAPVTDSGMLVVDGVLSSSYSSLDLFGSQESNAHKLLDFAAAPLKALARRPGAARLLNWLISGRAPTNTFPKREDVMSPVLGVLEQTYKLFRRSG